MKYSTEEIIKIIYDIEETKVLKDSVKNTLGKQMYIDREKELSNKFKDFTGLTYDEFMWYQDNYDRLEKYCQNIHLIKQLLNIKKEQEKKLIMDNK